MRKKFDVSAAPCGPRPAIAYPGRETVEWYGFKRHNFELNGRPGFIVEPPNPAPGLPWHWCIQWAEAFVPRTPALKLLERGFHHVFYDVFDTCMNEDGVDALEDFYCMLRSLGFHPKTVLTGMSYGGLFSLRWAAEHPETVAAIYLDAPVCTLDFRLTAHLRTLSPEQEAASRKDAARIAKLFRTTVKGLAKHPLAPINNVRPIAEAKIPIFCIRSGQDMSVEPRANIDVFAERLQAEGGVIEVMRRDFYGHHPHGLPDPTPLADFMLRHYPGFETPRKGGRKKNA